MHGAFVLEYKVDFALITLIYTLNTKDFTYISCKNV